MTQVKEDKVDTLVRKMVKDGKIDEGLFVKTLMEEHPQSAFVGETAYGDTLRAIMKEVATPEEYETLEKTLTLPTTPQDKYVTDVDAWYEAKYGKQN